jgi:tetratricopeptide (TPR) repeat protein
MASMVYRILGPLQIRVVDGPDESWEPVTGPHATLLALLLVNADRTVPHAQLIRALWRDPPATAQGQLHKRITDLRELLRRAGRVDRLINDPDIGYRLRVADGELDAWEFQRLVSQAEGDLTAGRADAAYAGLRDALGRWQDRLPLVGIDSPMLSDAAAALVGRRLRAAERMFAIALGQGDDELILDLAPQLVEPDPTWERLWAAWIIALYRTERRAQAMETCHRFDELDHAGHNPLRELCYAVGRGDTGTIQEYASRLVARRMETLVAMPLPPDLPDLTGRREQIEELLWLLSSPGRVAGPVVLTGPTGCGKSVIAVHAAHRLRPHFPGGIHYADLRGAQPQPAAGDEVLARLLRTLGLPAADVPADRAARAAAYQQWLTGRRMLLVLDDAADANSVADLLPGDPDSTVATLVTSQDRLEGLPRAHRIPLAELNLGDAVALYRRVASGGGADLSAERLEDLCQLVDAVCGRLPLAIRVAGVLRASAYRHLTSSELASLIAMDPVESLVHEHLDVPAAITAGFRRLDGPARTLLRRLSVLDLPDFAPWLAAAVLDQPPAVADQVLSRLTSRSLLSDSDGARPGRPRYRFHDLTRRYFRRRAQETEDPAAVIGRGYGALLALAEAAHRRIFGGDFEVMHGTADRWHLPAPVREGLLADPLAWFEQERLNLRAAVAHAARAGNAALSWDLAVSSHEFYAQRGWFDDWSATHTTALEACRSTGDDLGAAAVLTCLAQPALVSSGRGAPPDPEVLDRAVALFADAGDRQAEAFARRTLGSALRRAGDFAAAEYQLAEARRGYRLSGDQFGAWHATRLLGQTCLDRGDADRALRYLFEARELAPQAGHPRAVPQATYWIGRAYLAQGALPEATDCFRQSLAAAESAGDRTGVAYARYGLGEAAYRDGRQDEAVRLLAEARRAAQSAHDRVLEGRILRSLGELHRTRGDQDAARHHLAEAVERFGQVGAAWLRARALADLRRLG